jgi:hypothetical protein
MDKYQEAIFDFATMDENFEFTFEIGNNFELFRRKLISDFWDSVVRLLNGKVSELNGWIAWREDEVVKGAGTIAGIYSMDYYSDEYDVSVSTSFCNWGDGRILYGVCFNKEVPTIKYDKIMSSAKKTIKGDWRFAPESWYYPVYKYTDENFNNYSSLRKILPNQKELLAEEYADNLIAAHKELYFLIDKFGIKF